VFVEAVVVDAGQRRRGIATAMLERILADVRSCGCNKVQLLSHKRHAADGAHRRYARLGFEPEAEGFRLYLTSWETPQRSRIPTEPPDEPSVYPSPSRTNRGAQTTDDIFAPPCRWHGKPKSRMIVDTVARGRLCANFRTLLAPV
jgi:hypothetical protein